MIFGKDNPCCSTRARMKTKWARFTSRNRPASPKAPWPQFGKPGLHSGIDQSGVGQPVEHRRYQRVCSLARRGPTRNCTRSLAGNRPGSSSKRVAVVPASGCFPAGSITFCVLLGRPYCTAAFSSYVKKQEIALAMARICSAKCDSETSDQRSGVASGKPSTGNALRMSASWI
jgi:hypothetical protein